MTMTSRSPETRGSGLKPSNRLSINTVLAVRSHNPERPKTQTDIIGEYLADCGRQGATRDQIYLHTGIRIGSITARVNELIEAGEVEIIRPAKHKNAARTSTGDVASLIRLVQPGTEPSKLQPMRRGQLKPPVKVEPQKPVKVMPPMPEDERWAWNQYHGAIRDCAWERITNPGPAAEKLFPAVLLARLALWAANGKGRKPTTKSVEWEITREIRKEAKRSPGVRKALELHAAKKAV